MTNFVRRLAETALSRGWLERPAYFVDESVYRFEDVFAGADRAAAAFASRGLGRGARILIALPDGIEFVWAFLGALRIGAVAVPVNSMFHPDEMRRAAEIARPAAVVSDPEFADRFTVPVLTPDALRADDALVPPYAPVTDDTPAFAAFTSGTTGGPKLCFHTHGDPEILTRAAGAAVGVTADDVSYSVPRMNFAYGLGNSLFFPLLTGGSTVLTPRRLAPGDSLAVLEKYGVTVFYSQPTFFAHMLGHPDARRVLDGLRVAVVAGEVLPESLERELRGVLGPRLLNVYGTTEIGHALLANGPDTVREFTLGRVLTPYRLRVVDDRGKPVPAGVEGRLEVAGPTIGLGVPSGDEAPIRLTPDEWYATSDAAVMDTDGFVRVHGRLDDIEIVAGINVHPTEIEDRLMAHSAVEEAAVCAVRRDSGISVLRAYAVLRHSVDEATAQALRDELLDSCRSSLTWYKVPEDVIFVTRLPRNPTGKLLRRTIRVLAADDALR
ncbi:class I adenylate-forming enzyme family protein [Streptomyces lateritius]|uniref:class I adenylate-forming enzyme family protein n=1 Tax=Streptomyces lateritius TaxID=67313 RepID=UPI001C8C0F23|nr:AMP-binding protein [Streptomyces lateritius]MBX9427597.1 AMP-binding protein [Streptomyces lateritius]